MTSRDPKATASPGPTSVHSLTAGFSELLARSPDQSFAQRLELWDELIERPHQALFDRLIWRKSGDADWQQTRSDSLASYFEYYAAHGEEIVRRFEAFEETLRAQIAKYADHFPDAHFDLPVYGVPSAGRLNGGAGTVNGGDVLAFGIDCIVRRGDPEDVLYAHELFHVYHVGRIGTADWGTSARLTLPLWLEGLATHASAVMCPGYDDAGYLFDTELGSIPPAQGADLARTFLEDADSLAWAPSGADAYARWFLPGSSASAETPAYPERAGYYLGLQAVRRVEQIHALTEIVEWQPPRVHAEVLDALRAFAAAPAD